MGQSSKQTAAFPKERKTNSTYLPAHFPEDSESRFMDPQLHLADFIDSDIDDEKHIFDSGTTQRSGTTNANAGLQPGAIAVRGPDFQPEVSTMTIVVDGGGDNRLSDTRPSQRNKSTGSEQNLIVAAEIAPDIVSAEIVQDEQLANHRINELEEMLREATEPQHEQEAEEEAKNYCFHTSTRRVRQTYLAVACLVIIIVACVLIIITQRNNNNMATTDEPSTILPTTVIATSAPTEPTLCSLCSPGTFVTKGNHTPGKSDKNCSYLEEYEIPELNITLCGDLEDDIEDIADECGCQARCPDGSLFSDPDFIFAKPMPWAAITCSELTRDSNHVKQVLEYEFFAYEKCGCKVPSDFCKDICENGNPGTSRLIFRDLHGMCNCSVPLTPMNLCPLCPKGQTSSIPDFEVQSNITCGYFETTILPFLNKTQCDEQAENIGLASFACACAAANANVTYTCPDGAPLKQPDLTIDLFYWGTQSLLDAVDSLTCKDLGPDIRELTSEQTEYNNYLVYCGCIVDDGTGDIEVAQGICENGDPLDPAFLDVPIDDFGRTCESLALDVSYFIVDGVSDDYQQLFSEFIYYGHKLCGCEKVEEDDDYCDLCEDGSVIQPVTEDDYVNCAYFAGIAYAISATDQFCPYYQGWGEYCGCNNPVVNEEVCRLCGDDTLLPDVWSDSETTFFGSEDQPFPCVYYEVTDSLF